uniref:Uncharacterized protein n=1 Tax=Ciona intestinalis TaxID=7719 RepID=F6UQ59_CIOIN
MLKTPDNNPCCGYILYMSVQLLFNAVKMLCLFNKTDEATY